MSGATTALGRSGTILRRLAFGCEQLGGYDWGPLDLAEVEAAVECAVEEGVTLFDTADCYGRGESERRLGRLLKPHRADVLIATKFGVRFRDSGEVWYDSSPQWARSALEQSLRRLQTECVDLLQMHYWDGHTPLAELCDCLESLRREGKIRWYGVTNYPLAPPLAAAPGLVSSSLEFNLLERGSEALARELDQVGVTFLPYGALAQGLLTGKYPRGARFDAGDRRSRAKYRHFHGPVAERNARIVEVLCAQAARLGVLPGQLAVAWILHILPGSVPLVGVKRTQQLSEVLRALQLEIPAEVMAALDVASRLAAPA